MCIQKQKTSVVKAKSATKIQRAKLFLVRFRGSRLAGLYYITKYLDAGDLFRMPRLGRSSVLSSTVYVYSHNFRIFSGKTP